MKGNDGRGARRILVRKVGIIVGITAALTFMIYVIRERDENELNNNGSRNKMNSSWERGDTGSNSLWGRMGRLGGGSKSRNNDAARQAILEADYNLVDLILQSDSRRGGGNPENNVKGVFCRVDWQVHKKDPSSTPMFRDLIAKSPHCRGDNKVVFPLNEIAEAALEYDKAAKNKRNNKKRDSPVKVLKLGGVVFHESRCGSTLVANLLASAYPEKHRVYSESGPPLMALQGVCGEEYERCSLETAAKLLQNVIYLMSRSNDASEEHVFFKIQSAGAKHIPVFTNAFPMTPWIFVYRDPVQVMMSQMAHGPKYANCVRSKRNPPERVLQLAIDAANLSPEYYCAVHLASITTSALSSLRTPKNLGMAVNYEQLPDILWNYVLPQHYKVPVTQAAMTRMHQTSLQYSKGRGNKSGEFKGDSEEKEQKASDEIRQGAAQFLQESYDALEKLAGRASNGEQGQDPQDTEGQGDENEEGEEEKDDRWSEQALDEEGAATEEGTAVDDQM